MEVLLVLQDKQTYNEVLLSSVRTQPISWPIRFLENVHVKKPLVIFSLYIVYMRLHAGLRAC